MFEKIQQRLIKETLIAINRRRPDTLHFPVYFLPAAQSHPQELGEIVRSLHEIPEIPWPDTECIVLAEDHTTNLLSTASTMMIGLIHTDKEKNRFNRVPKADTTGSIEPIDAIAVLYDHKTGKINSREFNFMMMHILRQASQVTEAAIKMYTDKRLAGEMPAGVDSEAKQRYREFLMTSAPRGESYWTTYHMGERGDKKYQMGLASDMLCYLANIAVPCHYVVKSCFEKGFGPTGAMQRAMAMKPIFSVINYDRLYRYAVGQGKGEYEVEPHARRGHIRYHWRKGRPPLDFRRVPQNTLIRLRLARINSVPKTYIPPTWVGQHVFSDEQAVHEILTKEIPLKTFGIF